LHIKKFKKGRHVWWKFDGYLREILVKIVGAKGCDGIMWYKVEDFERGVYWVDEKDLKFKRPSDKW
jgi:hypothetical protein